MTKLKEISVVLYGCGAIGRGVLRRLQAGADNLGSRYGLSFNVVACCDSTGMAATTDGSLDIDDVLAWKEGGNGLGKHPKYGGVSNPDTLLKFASPSAIFVDTAATPDHVSTLVSWVQDAEGGAVLANKSTITACDTTTFRKLTNHQGRFRYESTVGAGTPFVSSVRRVLAGCDTVTSISGTFSGTLGYITSGLDDGNSFSELVRTAHANNLTEPDPRDDLSGTDVARKALILARTLGWEYEMEQLDIGSLYPESMASLSVQEFLAATPDIDADIQAQFEAAAKNDSVLRYVADIRDGKVEVGLKAVSASGPIGSLKGTDNIMNVTTTDSYSTPLVVQGSGAGVDVTASGIVCDMVDISLNGLK